VVHNGKSASDLINELVKELNKNLKELTDMAQVLGQDSAEQYLTIQSNNSQTHRRAYVRSVIALIEGVLHRMKLTAAHLGGSMRTLSIQEIVVINEVAFEVNDEGEVVSKSVFIKFLNNVKFAFSVYSKSFGSPFELSLGGNGWQNLRECVKVRNRLMHPKTTTDLEVAEAEVEAAKTAFDWFLISYALCSHHAQKAAQAKTSASPEDIAALEAKILELETRLAKNGG
jgi:hypothetical protein